jgi:transposase
MAVKYVALDLHQASTSISVRDSRGRVVRREVVPTSAATILDFVKSAGGTIHITFEEGTLSQWLYDQLAPHVARVVVCDPRHNRLLGAGNKSDRIDADKLSDLLRLGALRPVYHERSAVAALRELVRSYNTLVEDSTRVMLRIKAIFRSRAIECSGTRVYHPKNRARFLAQLSDRGARLRAEHFYLELDHLLQVRAQARHQMLEEAKRHGAVLLLRSVPFIGPVRAATIVAIIVTPHRFRTRRQLWPYAGLAVTTRSSADHRFEHGAAIRSTKGVSRGLNRNFNRTLKKVFKEAAASAVCAPGPLGQSYERLLAHGMRPELARLTIARKIASIVLAVWKKGVPFDPKILNAQNG